MARYQGLHEAGRDRGRRLGRLKLGRLASADEMPALHDPADLSALPRVVVFALAVTAVRRAGNNEAERIATMSGPERAIGQAAGKPIGEDLRAVEIKHWQIKDHPDHLPEGIDYYSLYQLTTTERVFFFEATHRITRLPGDAIELDISV